MDWLRTLEEAWVQNDIDYYMHSISKATYLEKCSEIRYQVEMCSKSYKKRLRRVQYGLD